jgi:hypothetical protein
MTAMGDWQTDDLVTWLDAEQAGAEDAADTHFAALFARHVPAVEPPPAFTDRAMLAWHQSAGWRLSTLLTETWIRATMATAVVVMGVALAMLSPHLAFDVMAGAAGAAARLAHGAVVTMAVGLDIGRVALSVVVTLGRAAALLATTGAMPAILTANLLLALGSCFGLKRLLAPREEYS